MRRKRSEFVVVFTSKSDAKTASKTEKELQGPWGYTKPHKN
ncbi:MAG: hypothetical protein ACO3S8_07850 [Aquiluna sp.]